MIGTNDSIPATATKIEINLSRLPQLFNSLDPSPFHERDLDHDAENRSRLQIWLRRNPIRPLRNWVVRGHISLCQCSKKTSLSVPLVFTAKRSAHSPRNRLNW